MDAAFEVRGGKRGHGGGGEEGEGAEHAGVLHFDGINEGSID